MAIFHLPAKLIENYLNLLISYIACKSKLLDNTANQNYTRIYYRQATQHVMQLLAVSDNHARLLRKVCLGERN